MAMSPEIKKQVAVALYSSLAVSVLTTTPVFIMTKAPFHEFPGALLFTTLMSIAMWAVNIGLFLFFRRRRWVRYVFSFLLSMLLAVGMFHGLAFPRTGGFGSMTTGFYFHVILFFAVDTVLLIIQDLVVVRERKAAVELENAQLRMRNMEAVNLQLKQQVQPHFLFNSLSTLKSLIRHSPVDAEAYVLKLSGFLRSSMASHAATLVSVEEEVALCMDYLELQRIRFGDALRFSVEVPVKGALPVFALQGLIENAIKHNVLTREQPLRIWLKADDRSIRVTNNLQLREDAGGEGTGLANLRERYRMLGGGEIVVIKTETEFSVEIPVL
ncbi:sensor histidine kinase [Puia sp.]|jgi:hypothetical protein|uniref:sensor histidine kinase n=1 Tax=Puia sp. TaxID=2045100 RepID=UPI002F4175DA